MLMPHVRVMQVEPARHHPALPPWLKAHGDVGILKVCSGTGLPKRIASTRRATRRNASSASRTSTRVTRWVGWSVSVNSTEHASGSGGTQRAMAPAPLTRAVSYLEVPIRPQNIRTNHTPSPSSLYGVRYPQAPLFTCFGAFRKRGVGLRLGAPFSLLALLYLSSP